VRIEIRHEGEALVVRMPPARALAQWLIAASWLPFVAIAAAVVWVASGTFEALQPHGAYGIAQGVFFLVFSLFLLAVALVGFAGSLYGLLGHEVAHVEGRTLTLQRVLFGARVRQRFEDVRNLRIEGHVPDERRRWSAPPPKIVFESAEQKAGFGSGLTDEEAEEVLGALKEALR
jgi:hypothetical protein